MLQLFQSSTIPYYLYQALARASFSRALFILFLSHRGLSQGQIGLLQSALFAANVLSEIPTGVIGDKYGRKISVLIGLSLLATNAVGMLFAQDFWLFFALFVIQGLGFSFKSGSDEALFYDMLKRSGMEPRYEQIASRAHAVGTASFGLSMICGGFLANISWSLLYVGNLAATTLAFVVFVLVKDTTIPHDTAPNNSKFEMGSDSKDDAEAEAVTQNVPFTIKNVFSFLSKRDGKSLLMLIVALALFEAAITPYFVFAQSLFDAQGLSERSIALVYGVLELSGAALSLANSFVRRHVNRNVLIVGGMLLCSALIAMNGLVSGFASFVIFALTMCIPDLFHASANALLHESVSSEMRATMLSLESFFMSLFIGGSYTVAGFLFEVTSPPRAIALMSIFPLAAVSMLFVSFSLRQQREIADPRYFMESEG